MLSCICFARLYIISMLLSEVKCHQLPKWCHLYIRNGIVVACFLAHVPMRGCTVWACGYLTWSIISCRNDGIFFFRHENVHSCMFSRICFYCASLYIFSMRVHMWSELLSAAEMVAYWDKIAGIFECTKCGHIRMHKIRRANNLAQC